MLALENLFETRRADCVAAGGEDLGKTVEGVVAVDTDRAIKEFRLHLRNKRFVCMRKYESFFCIKNFIDVKALIRFLK